ncbi:hypothetical protein SAMN04488591_2119 [Microbacterium azadirachtae]|uniref:Uncharacterized protein n=1 Tax=Microbacterium azadirachtae TaxID=582680 RepID=A0A1I6HSV0_9MICO|nr:hypothetical protein [Microbacterium azadirachtae]SFR57542.1 hypothetical protein SAMN04488591_2119 [Microbacterium azadirachtae]
MRGRTWSLRGFVPAAIAGGLLAVGWVALSIAFGSGSAQAAETAPPPPPTLLGTLQSTVGAVQDTIAAAPVTVQSTVTAVQQTVAETLPDPVAVVAPEPAPVADAAPADVAAPRTSVVAPIVEAAVPLLRSVDQTAGVAVDTVTGTVGGTVGVIAPALTPVLSPVDAVLHRVPVTLDTVTSALPALAVSLDDTVGTVGGTVRDATGLIPVPITVPSGPAIPSLPGGGPSSGPSTPPGAPAPVSAAGTTLPATEATTRLAPAPDAVSETAQQSASPGSTSPLSPAHHPGGSPASELDIPGAGSAAGGSAVDVRLLGTVSSLSAGDRLLTVRSGSAGDDRLPASPVADHDSSPD